MTQREKDMRAERELSKFLERNFYGELVKAERLRSFQRIEDTSLQKQGIDVIAVTPGAARMNIDEKAQLHYINNGLPTFALELDFILDGDVVDGWFLNDGLKTTHYLFLWPNAMTTDLAAIVSGDFTEVEGVLVSKRRLKEHLDERGLDRACLKEQARRIREQRMQGRHEISLDGSGTVRGLKLYASLSIREQPINLVVNKRILIQLAGRGGHYIITQGGCSLAAGGYGRP